MLEPIKYYDWFNFLNNYHCFVFDFCNQKQIKATQNTTCKMEWFIFPLLEAPRRPTSPQMPQSYPLRRLKDNLLAPKTLPRRLLAPQDGPQDGPKTSRRSPMPSGRFILCPAAPEAVQKPCRPRFWTFEASILHSPDVDLAGPTELIVIPGKITNDDKSVLSGFDLFLIAYLFVCLLI